jgi:sugar lactone lactonase YvrE
MIKNPLYAGVRLLFFSILLTLTFAAPVNADRLAPGEVSPVLEFASPNSPEGIAVDKRGNIYVGVRFYDFSGMVTRSEILKLRRNGRVSVFANLPDIAGVPAIDPAVGNGVLGLAADDDGNIYAAFDSRVDATKGIYRVDRKGNNLTRLTGSEGMIFPNFLTFDDDGNLYASDSFGGSIWRFPEPEDDDEVAGALWVQDEGLLEPTFVDIPGFGILPGINGIVFFPPNHIYAANTDKSLIARVDIGSDGDAETPQFVAGVPFPDGLAVDKNGDVYAVIPPHALLGLPAVVKIDQANFSFIPIVIDPTGFDVPLSLVFGRGKSKRNVFVTNGELFGPGFGAGPNVLEVGIGVKGFDPFADDDDSDDDDD